MVPARGGAGPNHLLLGGVSRAVHIGQGWNGQGWNSQSQALGHPCW